MTESNGKISGSARSVKGFDIHHAIEKCSEHLIQFGGHKYAAGLVMAKEKLDDFKTAFEKEVSNTIQEDQKTAKLDIDLEIKLDDIDFELFNVMKQMGPFGPYNMQPVFSSTAVFLKNDPRLLKEKHLKLHVSQGGTSKEFDAIGFGLGEFHNQLDGPFDIAYTIEENHFRGNTTLQLVLKDIRV